MKKILYLPILAAVFIFFSSSCGEIKTASIFFTVTGSCTQANVSYNSPSGTVSGIQTLPFTSQIYTFESVINPTITASTGAPAACNFSDTVTCNIYKDGVLWKTAGPSQSCTASGEI